MLKYLFLIFLISSVYPTELLRLDLTNWNFSIPSKYNDTLYPAKIPSNIHIDLLENKLINDPYYRNNQNEVKWIHDVVVSYETKFKLPGTWGDKMIELVFEGLDTYANISLNGIHLKSTNNSFVKVIIKVENLKPN
jgi:beta-mannosidase